MSRPPIAILGVGCRFPQADGVDQFWQLLRGQVDAISQVPAERWNSETVWNAYPGLAGYEQCRWGGFVADGDCFDAEFFGINAAEAERMDPQQGMVLEAAWQALEHAAKSPHSLRGSQTGVFVGISSSDYDRRLCRDLRNLDVRAGTGTSYSIVANRLSYVLGLGGPSIAVDLACSSSLCAVHLACQSLWLGDCELALAGGVHLMLSPEKTVTFSRGNILASDGRCKSFSANANGYVRGEGCGIVVLKLLAEAERDGDPIFAVIRGSAINHNGLSNGLSAPSGASQRALMERALRVGGVEPGSIGYVEAHSTGTLLGDLIEVNALKKLLSLRRATQRPCLIGSVKPNIGHLEAAAGVASLIKAVLIVREGWIPRTLATEPVNPGLGLESSGFEIAGRPQPWPSSSEVRRAGVSSFSFGGANAHIIVEQPADARAREPAAGVFILPLSARSRPALLRLSQLYSDFLATLEQKSEPVNLFADACYTAAVARTHFAHRLSVIAADPAEARRLLQRWPGNTAAGSLAVGVAKLRRAIYVVYAFANTGQCASDVRGEGSRWINSAVAFLGRCGIHPDGLLRVDYQGGHAGRTVNGVAACSSSFEHAASSFAPEARDIVEYDLQRDQFVTCSGKSDIGRRHDASDVLLVAFGRIGSGLPNGHGLCVAVESSDRLEGALMGVVGRAYACGMMPEWPAVFADRSRISGLPTYPFERHRFWNDGVTRIPQQ